MIEILVEEYQDLEELFWKVKLPDLPAVIVDSDSKQSIKSGLRKTLKPDSFKEISIDRVTKSEKRKMHLALAQGLDDEEQVDEDVPTNSASSGAIAMPADAVRRKKKKYQEFTVSDDVYHKFRNGKMKFERWSKYLNLENEGERAIYDYARKNYRGICVLRHEDTGQVRAIRYSRTGGGSWGNIQRIRDRVVETTLNFTRLDEDVLDVLRNNVKNKQMQKVKFKDKKTASVDMFTASAMVKVYDALNKDNQGKFKDMINKNKGGFMAMQSFAMKKVR